MKLKKTLLAMAASSLCMGAAQAGIVVDNWDLDTTLATIEGGVLDTKILAFDQMTFNGIARSVTDITGGTDAGNLDIGDLAAITVYGKITSFIDSVNGVISVPELNSEVTVNGKTGWEMSFVFEGTTQVTGLLGDDLDFEHISGGTLMFYIDNLENGGKAVNGDASTFSDGTLVLSMTDDGTGSGNTDFNDLDGNDDANFLVSAANALANLSGVFTRDGGAYDHGTTEGSDMTVDSNFDLDPDNNGIINTSYGAFTAPACGSTETTFCAEEDGSVRLSAVPEPGTLALLGLGLMGFGAVYRRRSK